MVCADDGFRDRCTTGADDNSLGGVADEVEHGARKGIVVDTFDGTPSGLDDVDIDITEVTGAIGITELPCPGGSIDGGSTIDIGCIK